MRRSATSRSPALRLKTPSSRLPPRADSQPAVATKETIMSTQSFAYPAPQSLGVARTMAIFRKETKYEFLKLLRNRSFSLAVIGFPVMFYLLFGVANRGANNGGIPMARYLLGGYACFGLIGAALFGMTIAGSISFASMGFLLALIVPANAAPAIVNLIYLPMSFMSGLWMPIQHLPHWLQRVAPVLPTYHLAQLMLRIFGYGDHTSIASHWFGLAGFTMLMLGTSWLIFNRAQQNA